MCRGNQYHRGFSTQIVGPGLRPCRRAFRSAPGDDDHVRTTQLLKIMPEPGRSPAAEPKLRPNKWLLDSVRQTRNQRLAEWPLPVDVRTAVIESAANQYLHQFVRLGTLIRLHGFFQLRGHRT